MKIFFKFFIITVLILFTGCQTFNTNYAVNNNTKNSKQEKFSIWTSTLEGKNIKKLFSDSYRQMTHIRVSPDKKWFTFSRYNQIGKNGCATELPDNYKNPNSNYIETEIMLGNLQTLEVKSLIPPKKNQVAVNSYWNSEGDKMLFVSVPQNTKKPQIDVISFDRNKNIRKIDKINLPEFLLPVDPHQVKDKIVFPAVNTNNKTRGLWIINSNGTNLRQLTFPSDPKTGKIITFDQGGDNDPKISPDGKTVAFMRIVKWLHLWHIFTVDIETGVEKDLSANKFNNQFEADAVPEWSGDGKLLGIWHINALPWNRKLYILTMNPDGSNRKVIKLPEGNFYQSIAFFPDEASNLDSNIIFSVDNVSMICSK